MLLQYLKVLSCTVVSCDRLRVKLNACQNKTSAIKKRYMIFYSAAKSEYHNDQNKYFRFKDQGVSDCIVGASIL